MYLKYSTGRDQNTKQVEQWPCTFLLKMMEYTNKPATVLFPSDEPLETFLIPQEDVNHSLVVE
jgi:hypothetical protein